MKNILTVCSFIVLSAAAGLTVPAYAQDGADAPLTRAEVNSMIETFIQENPSVIISSLQQFEIDEQKRIEEEAAQKLGEYETYFTDGDLPRVGNEDGDVKIVEFYDYNCGYCKRAFNDIQLLLEADPNVQVIFIEMPILGEGSLETAKWSIAAHMLDEGKFFDYHTALMNFSGQKNTQSLKSLAEASGFDVAALEAKVNESSDEIASVIEKNISVARDVGIRGTPGFVINGEIYRGYLGYDGMKAVIDEIRLSNQDDPQTNQPDDTAAAVEE